MNTEGSAVTHPSDAMQVQPVIVLETVQARGEVSTRYRETVQDTSKLAQVYSLPGETMAQKVAFLQQWVASNRVFNQLELLGYIEDILLAPSSLETYEVDVDMELTTITSAMANHSWETFQVKNWDELDGVIRLANQYPNAHFKAMQMGEIEVPADTRLPDNMVVEIAHND